MFQKRDKEKGSKKINKWKIKVVEKKNKDTVNI